jgi:hypothetical protein
MNRTLLGLGKTAQRLCGHKKYLHRRSSNVIAILLQVGKYVVNDVTFKAVFRSSSKTFKLCRYSMYGMCRDNGCLLSGGKSEGCEKVMMTMVFTSKKEISEVDLRRNQSLKQHSNFPQKIKRHLITLNQTYLFEFRHVILKNIIEFQSVL